MNKLRVIFVFGSNLAGRHGKGAALTAKKNYGAIQGVGIGIRNDSYAIPTKDYKLASLPLNKISMYVDDFILFAIENSHLSFWVTRIGCGLAGYSDRQIAPMFAKAPSNCQLPKEWKDYKNEQE